MSFLSSCTSGGCGAKIGAGELATYLAKLPKNTDSKLLVGFDRADDAAVYQLNDEQALISTVDFFSPMVEDPRMFGRIAAANALSDIYAMGGKVLYGLSLVCFPQQLDKEILAEILAGGAEKVSEAGASLAGGHSIYDHEPKYGLAVTGLVHPEKFLRNDTPQPEDVLILTKALGVGLVQSAVRVGLASEEATAAALASMCHLNKYAAEKLAAYPVHACTDVTGFGLLGHASEMAGTEQTLIIDTAALPLLPDALHYAEAYLATAGGERNRRFVTDKVDLTEVPPAYQELLLDPQTSGGLLISVAAEAAADLLQALQVDDPAAAIIGMVASERGAKPLVIL